MSCLLGSFALGLVQVRACRREANRGVDRKADKGGLTGRITPPICRVFHLKTAREVRFSGPPHSLSIWRWQTRERERCAESGALATRTSPIYGAQSSISSTSREVRAPGWREMLNRLWRHDTTDQVVGSRQNHGR